MVIEWDLLEFNDDLVGFDENVAWENVWVYGDEMPIVSDRPTCN